MSRYIGLYCPVFGKAGHVSGIVQDRSRSPTCRLERFAHFVYDEERIQVIGMAHVKVLFVIVALAGEDTSRIISARKATRHEQDRYYAGNRETW